MKKNIYFLFCMVLTLTMFGCTKRSEPVKLNYYYFNPCGSCDESGEFIDLASSLLKGIDSSEYQIITVNTFKDEMPSTLEEFLEANKLNEKDIDYPMITAGSSNYIIGLQNIKQGMRELLLSQINNKDYSFKGEKKDSLPSPSKQNNLSSDSVNEIDKNKSYFLYFYTTSCNDCNNTKSFFETLPKSYKLDDDGKEINSEIVIERKNITQQNNLSELQSFFEYYKVPKYQREVPIIFYKSGYISGYQEIKKNMQLIIQEGKALKFDYSAIKLNDNINNLNFKDLPGIFFTGLINGINPCSISMLFLLLSLVIAKRNSILKLGFSYIFGKIVAYFSFGIATYSLVSLVDSVAFRNLQYTISIVLTLAALIIAFFNFRDAYWAKKERYDEIKMQLPSKLRKYNHKIINYFTQRINSGWALIVLFVLGIIISLGEFLCTGQIYVATIIYLAQSTSNLNSITILSFILYVLAASVPLIILVILINKTKNLLVISEFVRKHIPTIKVIYGILFIVFGVLIWINVI